MPRGPQLAKSRGGEAVSKPFDLSRKFSRFGGSDINLNDAAIQPAVCLHVDFHASRSAPIQK